MASNNPGLDVQPHEYPAKPFDEEYDVEIKVKYHLVVGHEIIGHVTRVGSKVDSTKYPIGARVGVGAQCGSCLNCNQCNQGNEQVCDNGALYTYNGTTAGGYVTQGAYADYYRCHFKFVIPIPEALSSESAAPMIITEALSSSARKEKDSKEVLGAHHYLNYSDFEAVKAHAKAFDILLVTSYSKDTVWDHLLALTATNGKLVLVGLPEKPISFFPFSVVSRQVTFVGSTIGSPAELEEMLAFAVAKGVNSIVEVMPMNEAATALQRCGMATFVSALSSRTKQSSF
ncbi:unnamed protein product [Aphanomyces euteiches]